MVVTVLDESSDRGKSIAYGVGGFFMHQPCWNIFETAWKPTSDELAEQGIVFHMADCERWIPFCVPSISASTPRST